MSAIRTYNVEAGLPILDEARRLVIGEIKRAKREGVKVLRVIHGYGSSGKGGTLCVGLRKSFGLRKKEGVIKDFVAGEEFSIFNPTVLALLEAVPELRGDPELNSANEGVYAHLNPMPFEAAMQMEIDLAEDLRRAGYTVTGGH